jgi:hypothetical protein
MRRIVLTIVKYDHDTYGGGEQTGLKLFML